MNLQKKIDELVVKKEKIALEESKRLVDIFRRNIKSFEKLVRSYSTHKGHDEFKGGAYFEISKLLADDGITKKNGANISTAQIAKYLRQVRIEMGTLILSKSLNGKKLKFIQSDLSNENHKIYDELICENEEKSEQFTFEDKKAFYELTKIKVKNIEFSQEQQETYEKLVHKKGALCK